MKQKRHGQKIQNWHRPLWPDELKHSYRRERYGWDPVATIAASGGLHLVNESIWCDCPWGEDVALCDSCRRRYHHFDNYDPLEIQDDELDNRPAYYLREVLSEVENPPSPLIPLPNGFGKQSEDPKPAPLLCDQPLEVRLNRFLACLQSVPNSTKELLQWYEHSKFQPQQIAHLTKATEQFPRSIFALKVFAPFWLRAPEELAPEASFPSICRHLFERHAAPELLFDPGWFSGKDEPAYKWELWTIIVGFGGSLRRAALLFNWAIHGKFQHYLEQALKWPEWEKGWIRQEHLAAYAEVHRLGGNDRIYQRMASCDDLIFDVTCLDRRCETPDRATWEETVRWLVQHGNALSDEECESVLSWAHHLQIEAWRGGGRPFSWKGRTAASALRNAQQYEQQLIEERSWYRHDCNVSWKRHQLDWDFADGADSWSFVELTTAEQLREEGRTHMHCVGGYVWQCAKNRSAIVSLRLNQEPCITVELELASNRVVQARGKRNRQTNKAERRAIAQWLAERVNGKALDKSDQNSRAVEI